MAHEPVTKAISLLRQATRELNKVNHTNPLKNLGHIASALASARAATTEIGSAQADTLALVHDAVTTHQEAPTGHEKP